MITEIEYNKAQQIIAQYEKEKHEKFMNSLFNFTTADNCKIQYAEKYWAVTFSNPEMNRVCDIAEGILGNSPSWYKEPHRCFGLKENAEDYAKKFKPQSTVIMPK